MAKFSPKGERSQPAKFRQKGVKDHWGISPKWKFSTLGRVFTPKWQHSALWKSEKRLKIPPFLLSQTEISPVWTKSPLKDPSRLRSDAKFRQNGVTHGSDCQNRLERPHFRRLAHHAQNGIQPKGELSPKTAQKPSVNSQPSAKFQHSMGPKGSHSPKNGTSPKDTKGSLSPTGSKTKPSTPQIVRIPKPQGGKGDFIHH